MTSTSAGHDARQNLRKRLKFRSWHRGTKELDLLLGPFADSCLDDFSDAELAEYQILLDQPEPDLYEWILGRESAPATVPHFVLGRIVAFHAGRRRR